MVFKNGKYFLALVLFGVMPLTYSMEQEDEKSSFLKDVRVAARKHLFPSSFILALMQGSTYPLLSIIPAGISAKIWYHFAKLPKNTCPAGVGAAGTYWALLSLMGLPGTLFIGKNALGDCIKFGHEVKSAWKRRYPKNYQTSSNSGRG